MLYEMWQCRFRKTNGTRSLSCAGPSFLFLHTCVHVKMGCCQETSEGIMRGKKRLMDGTGKDSMWHERERYWDRRVHGGWGGEEDRGEMGTGGIVQSQLSHLPSFQLQNSANQCFVPSGQLVATVLYFRFFKDYLTGSYIYIMNFSCVCPQSSSLLLPSLWNPLLNRSPLYIKELS